MLASIATRKVCFFANRETGQFWQKHRVRISDMMTIYSQIPPTTTTTDRNTTRCGFKGHICKPPSSTTSRQVRL
jgi:hypothetical protein